MTKIAWEVDEMTLMNLGIQEYFLSDVIPPEGVRADNAVENAFNKR